MKYLIYILFLYFIGALEFLGSISLLVGCHYLFLLIGLGSFAYYIIVKRIYWSILCYISYICYVPEPWNIRAAIFYGFCFFALSMVHFVGLLFI